MASLDKECDELKLKYDQCFNQWYTNNYLKGDTTDMCAPVFKEYKKCVWKHIRLNKVDQLINDVVAENGIPECTENS